VKEAGPDESLFFSQLKAQISRHWGGTSRKRGSWDWQGLGPTYWVYRKLWNSQILNAHCSV